MISEGSNPGIEFSIQYIDLLKHVLKIEFNQAGTPVFVQDRIKTPDIKRLKYSIQDLHRSQAKDDAIQNMQSFSTKESGKIQTTAVGYSEDFSLQVKLGLLLGERLVLWDTVILSILKRPDDQIDISTLGFVANAYIQLKPIVEAGALIILPQPKMWLERAAKYYYAMPKEVAKNDILKGYINASALLQEGFILHPYLIENEKNYRNIVEKLPIHKSQYYSIEKADYHYTLAKILKNKTLAFLTDIDVANFFTALCSSENGALRKFQRKLSQKISFPNCGLSPQEKEKWIDEIISELETFVPKVNQQMSSHRVESGFMGLSALQATFGVFADAGSAGLLSVIFSGLGALGGVGSYLKTVFNPPKDPVIYQAFTKLNAELEKQFLRELQDIASLPGSKKELFPG
jgi:hypothetical protein